MYLHLRRIILVPCVGVEDSQRSQLLMLQLMEKNCHWLLTRASTLAGTYFNQLDDNAIKETTILQVLEWKIIGQDCLLRISQDNHL